MTDDPEGGAEKLREALLDAERTLERERALRVEAESLLLGVPRLTGARTADEVLDALAALLRPHLGFESCALLIDRGDHFAPAAQFGGLQELCFLHDAFVERMMAGRPAVMLDVSQVPAWQAQPPSVLAVVRSALLLPVRVGGRDALVVFGRSVARGFDASHRRIAERIAPIAGQALLAIEHLELQSARDTTRLLERVLGAVDLGWLVVAGGQILLGNPAAATLLPGALPQTPFPLSPPDSCPCAECGRPAPSGRARLDLADGEQRRILEVSFAGHAHRVSISGGDLVLIEDITRWVLAEERLQRLNADLVVARDLALAADRAKSQFLATMSHELRTPLTAILGFGDLLREEAESQGADWAMSDLASMRIAAEQLLQLIGDILDLARLESGVSGAHLEPVDVPELVAQVVATTRPLLQRGHNELEISVAPEAPVVFADRRRLRQVLLNLLSNAAKFTEHGMLTLEVRCEPGQVVFVVSDTGIGIAPGHLSQLFQPFVQLDSSYTRKTNGSGLGLAISRRFCESMGGRIEVESELGVGSRFSVYLPAPPEPSASALVPRWDEILVVHQDPALLGMLQAPLEREGYAVRGATELEGALADATARPPAAIVLDPSWPPLPASTLLARLRAHPATSSTPVVYASERVGVHGVWLGKPVDPTSLLSTVRALVAGTTGVVLVAEDDEDVRALLCRMLDRAGFVVRAVAHGGLVFDELERSSPDVLVLDLMMPVMTGFEVLLRLGADERWRDLPVVVLTAMELEPERQEQLRVAGTCVLSKAHDLPSGLLRELRHVLAQRAARR
jgi:signal transduction histidine kinase/CheY-like chemotaxis protein